MIQPDRPKTLPYKFLSAWDAPCLDLDAATCRIRGVESSRTRLGKLKLKLTCCNVLAIFASDPERFACQLIVVNSRGPCLLEDWPDVLETD